MSSRGREELEKAVPVRLSEDRNTILKEGNETLIGDVEQIDDCYLSLSRCTQIRTIALM